MLYLSISKGWMASHTARRVYFVCAFSLIYLFASVFAVALFAVRFRFASDVLLEILIWPGVIGTAILWVAMWYFWFSFDSSSWGKKAVWCFLLYLFAPYAQPLYYLLVYRRSALVKSGATDLQPPVQSKLLPTD